jgi:lipoate-protein ligase A
MPALAYHVDPPFDGPTNMAADECLAGDIPSEGARLRWYDWVSPTVSLGAFQEYGEWQRARCLAGLPVVRRPSGGGAILHGSDLTYAIAVDRGHPAAERPRLLYDAVHGAAVAVLAGIGLYAGRISVEDRTQSERFLCFHRRSEGDVVAGDCKVLGSAQRRHRRAVVQHGSLLIGAASDLVRDWPGEWPELTGIEALLGTPIDAPELRRAWTRAIADRLSLDPVECPPSACRSEAIAFAAERFRASEWISRR